MNPRRIAILALVAMTMQALLGGLRGPGALCLGGGHVHQWPESQAGICKAACPHESGGRLPVPADRHDDRCDCTDITVAVSDPLALPRDAGEYPALPPPALCCPAPPGLHAPAAQAGSWRDQTRDPGGGRRLALVRSTKLLI